MIYRNNIIYATPKKAFFLPLIPVYLYILFRMQTFLETNETQLGSMREHIEKTKERVKAVEEGIGKHATV